MDRVGDLVRSVTSLAKRAITDYVFCSRRTWGEGRGGRTQASVAALGLLLVACGGGQDREPEPSSTIAPIAAPLEGDGAVVESTDEPEATDEPAPTDTPEPATVTPLPPTATSIPPTDIPPTEAVAPPTVPPPPPPPEAPTDCVDINTAPLEDMRRIINLDDVRAPEAIRLRPYSRVEDLTRIKGIATVRINEILEQGLACVR